MAFVEKDAKERAKRRRENRVLADGNYQSSLFHSWVHGGPEAVGPDQAETIVVCPLSLLQQAGSRT